MGDYYSQLILSEDFNNLIAELQNLNVNFDSKGITFPSRIESSDYQGTGKIKVIEDISAIDLNPMLGYEYIKNSNYIISGYDESLISIPALEGTGYIFAHALVILNSERYIPILKLSFNFYTKSKILIEKSNLIKYTENQSIQYKIDYMMTRNELIIKYNPSNSIILIDGPLLGGQESIHNIVLNSELLKKKVIPVFIVKNSYSSLLVDNLYEGKYNSDFEFAFKILKKGQRTGLYYYQDAYNSNNAKIFTYLKPYDNVSPIRLEVHEDTYKSYKDQLNKIFNIIYYLLISQGDVKNPQPKIVAIAEDYAREVLKAVNMDNIIFKSGLIPTINYTRFGWEKWG